MDGKGRVQEFSDRFGWTVITDDNRYELFIGMVKKMLMDHSYKPVFLKAVLKYADTKGRIKIDDIVSYFKYYYRERFERGLPVEKNNSLFAKSNYTDKEVEYCILSNPFKRFETMNMMRHTKNLGIIEIDSHVWSRLSEENKKTITNICDEKLARYYEKLKS